MIPKECKRLAEVDLPMAVVSKHSARETSIRHGHPSTLHLWWMRRPLDKMTLPRKKSANLTRHSIVPTFGVDFC